MPAKFKDCFTPHAFYHSLFGLGLGLLLANYFAGLVNIWIALVLMAIAVVLDYMRK